ncbi:hypothetical protein G6L99_32160 [Agrobacterium rhizogenes]|uniref:hypothetical protein n=1 Tax=Rhizobium rhizogenes TaxID=359 RepID=UPI0015733C87|nr:hypothetical protein [Rhizobium rhizogenes]NTH16769.1 hypothetical protein [Rhizobium rhizogenes]
MNFNTSTFPIIWLRAADRETDDEERDFAKLELLLDRKEAFVFVTDYAFCAYDNTDANLTRRKLDWVQRNTPRLQSQVKALIQIEPDARRRVVALGFARLFFSFWGYPLVVVENEIDAIGLALELLTGTGWTTGETRCLH